MKLFINKNYKKNKKYFILFLPVFVSILIIIIFLLLKIDVSVFLEYEM